MMAVGAELEIDEIKLRKQSKNKVGSLSKKQQKKAYI